MNAFDSLKDATHEAFQCETVRRLLMKRRGGAPGGAASGQQASQTCRCGTRAPRDGIRNPVLKTGQAGGSPAGSSAARETPRSQGALRGLAHPWRLPALHSPLRRERENGTGHPRPSLKRAAQRWLLSFRGARSASPESITTIAESRQRPGDTEMFVVMDSGPRSLCSLGRNDQECVAAQGLDTE